jgi:hypothetical protein
MAEDVVVIWKDIEDWPRYEISNTGKVRNKETGRILKTYVTKSNSEKVTLNLENIGYKFAISRLVAKAFLPDFDPGLKVDHKDYIGTNNHVDNLQMGRPVPKRKDW